MTPRPSAPPSGRSPLWRPARRPRRRHPTLRIVLWGIRVPVSGPAGSRFYPRRAFRPFPARPRDCRKGGRPRGDGLGLVLRLVGRVSRRPAQAHVFRGFGGRRRRDGGTHRSRARCRHRDLVGFHRFVLPLHRLLHLPDHGAGLLRQRVHRGGNIDRLRALHHRIQLGRDVDGVQGGGNVRFPTPQSEPHPHPEDDWSPSLLMKPSERPSV